MLSRAPVGAGPYKLVEQKIGQSVELARFDQYYGRRPAIKRLIFKFIPDANSRVNALLTHEVDMADGIAPSDVRRVNAQSELETIAVPMGSPLNIRLYTLTPGTPLADRRVRLALNYAIDVNAIIGSVMHGIGKPLSLPDRCRVADYRCASVRALASSGRAVSAPWASSSSLRE